MRIIVDLSEYLVQDIRKLVGEGRYRDISSFIATSVENQLMLDSSDIESGIVLVAEPEAWHTTSRPSLVTDRTYALGDYSGAQVVPFPNWRERGEADWLWGQINKILPIKFAVRLLANEIATTGRLPLLDDFAQKAAVTARAFGLSLKAVDEREGHRRGGRLSTAFPVSQKIERAQQRFRTQFIGYVAGIDTMGGALPGLNLANSVDQDGESAIGLTQPGLDFAAIPNPVLDQGDYRLPLSDQEIDFYLDHIQSTVPWESSAFRLILSIVTDGIVGREEVNTAITERLAVAWKPAHLNTQRAGTMSRMFDLRLLSRHSRGRRVEYRTTERGEQWLSSATREG